MLDLTLHHESAFTATCIIFDIDSSTKLHDVRKRINDEVGNLMPANYMFIVGNHVQQITKEDIPLSMAIRWENNKPVLRYKESEFVGKSSKSSCEYEIIKDPSAPSSAAPIKVKENAFSKLKCPTTCVIKGIKIYSEEEIEKSHGKEHERRRFWNAMAREYAKKDIKKKDLYNLIHDEWRTKANKLLMKQRVHNAWLENVGTRP